MSDGGMSGVTYAGGSIYNVGAMCPAHVNQGYVCDGRNSGAQYLDPSTVTHFCSSHLGTSTEFGFGHGVSSSQKCGECAQLRVRRVDGSYNHMTVMMVDHFTWSMEVGTTEIASLLDSTQWSIGDRADFEFRIVNDFDCFASFDDASHDGDGTDISGTTLPAITSFPTMKPSNGPIARSSSGCTVSNNWGQVFVHNKYVPFCNRYEYGHEPPARCILRAHTVLLCVHCHF